VRHGARLAAWSLDKQKPQLATIVDQGAPQDVRDAFMQEYDAYAAALRDMDARHVPMQQVQPAMVPLQQLQQALKDRRLTEDEMKEFVEASRKARGAEATTP
jgi:uncharacterized protein YdiU (UPF0061 family)